MEQLTPEEQRQQDRFAQMVAQDLADGMGKMTIADKLMKNGCPDYQTAIGFVNSVEKAMIDYSNTPEGRADSYFGIMIGGLVAFIVGLGITLGSYWLSESIGTPFIVIAWGAVIFGGAAFLRGIIGYIYNKL